MVLAAGRDLADERACRARPTPVRNMHGGEILGGDAAAAAGRCRPSTASNARAEPRLARSGTTVAACAATATIRLPLTSSARSIECAPISAIARDAPPRASSTRQFASGASSSQSCRYEPRAAAAGRVQRMRIRDAATRPQVGWKAVVVREDGEASDPCAAVNKLLLSTRTSTVERLLADDILSGPQRASRRATTCRSFEAQTCTTSTSGAVSQRLRRRRYAARRRVAAAASRERSGVDVATPARPGAGQARRPGVHGADESGADDRGTQSSIAQFPQRYRTSAPLLHGGATSKRSLFGPCRNKSNSVVGQSWPFAFHYAETFDSVAKLAHTSRSGIAEGNRGCSTDGVVGSRWPSRSAGWPWGRRPPRPRPRRPRC